MKKIMNIDDFAVRQTAEVSAHIKAGTTISVMGIPSAGITLFIKHISTQPLGHVILVDAFSLTRLTAVGLFHSLLHKLGGDTDSENVEEVVLACKKQIQKLVEQHDRVVICITGFDLLHKDFGSDLFRYLRSLRLVDRAKVVFVFGICRPLETLLPQTVFNIDLSLFSSAYYLKPYSNQDLKYLLNAYGPYTELDPAEEDHLMELSGGHFRFLQLLIGSEKKSDPINDPFIQLAFKNVYEQLTPQRQAIVRKLAQDGTYLRTDDYLTNVGIIKNTKKGYELFSPLFADCVRALTATRLPVKERRLLAILKKHEGRVVSKRQIYDAVWRDDEVGSEWALNALVYRLRKHPNFIRQKYVIENHKKLGYTLIKSY